MSRVDELLALHAPTGVQSRTLGELGQFVRGSGLQKADLTDAGMPAIHYGQIHTHYGTWATRTKSFVSPEFGARLRKAAPGDLVIATTSEDDAAVAKATAWLGTDATAVSGDAFIFRHELNPKYVAYYFQTEQFHRQKQPFISGTKVRRVSGEALARMRIPVPPTEVQREIVRILDTFTELEAELEAELDAELEARRRQYQHHRAMLLAAAAERATWSTLGEISLTVSSGGTPSTGRADFYGGEIPWLRTQEVDFSVVKSTGVTITPAGLAASSAKWIPANCVIVAMYGATAAKVAINAIPMTTNQACCNLQIDPTRARFRYVFHWLCHEYSRLRALGEGSQSNLNARKIRRYPIAIPTLEEQDRIVAALDEFEALVKDLSIRLPGELAARRQQYEYYRERLLTFQEAMS